MENTKNEIANKLAGIYMREYRRYVNASITESCEEANRVYKRLMRLSKAQLNNMHIIAVGYKEQGSSACCTRIEIAEYVRDVLIGIASSCVLAGIGTHYIWVTFCKKDESYTYSGVERLEKLL